MTDPHGGAFATTRWTLVIAASRESAPGAREALARLCELYWPPIYSYARGRGYDVDRAQDLTQAFFARFLEKQDVQDADRRRGRFRSFLLASFKHFLANEYDRERAGKRGGGQIVLSLDVANAEAEYAAGLHDALTPEALYEQQWARGVIARAHTALRDEMTAAGKGDLFAQLADLLGGDRAEGGLAARASALGTTDGALRVTVHRMRRRVRELLRAELLATVADDADVDGEMTYLMDVWSRP